MLRNLIARFIHIGIWAVGSALFGQTADEPAGQSFAAASAVAQSRLIEPLQSLLDGPDQIIDLQGQTYVVATRLTIETRHSGKVIQNGTIVFTFSGSVPRVGGMEIVQGKRWWNAAGKSRNYPAGRIDLTLRDLVIDGNFDQDFGIQEFNEKTADEQGKGYNLITTVTNSAHKVRLERVRLQNCGNSGIAGSFRHLKIDDLTAERVAKHVVGVRGTGGSILEINRLAADDCGNALDLHNDGAFVDRSNPDVAVVKDLIVRNPRGRSKCSGNNFEIYGKNWLFVQDSVVNLNPWPAWDLAKNPRRCYIDGFTALNFWSMGIGMLTDTTTGGDIRFSNVYIDNSLSGIKGQQRFSVVDSIFNRIHHRYRSAAANFQSNNIDLTIEPDAYWAQVYQDIEFKLAAFNEEHRSHIVLRYWLPSSIRSMVGSEKLKVEARVLVYPGRLSLQRLE